MGVVRLVRSLGKRDFCSQTKHFRTLAQTNVIPNPLRLLHPSRNVSPSGFVNFSSRSQLGMPRTSWFIRPLGIRPCPLYTPPVAFTDELFCEYDGLTLRSI